MCDKIRHGKGNSNFPTACVLYIDIDTLPLCTMMRGHFFEAEGEMLTERSEKIPYTAVTMKKS